MENNNIYFAKRKGKSDKWFTPEYAVNPILKYLEEGKVIWCPFDTYESNFVKKLREVGFKVIATHLETGEDFFKYEPEEYDIIISNPPYSLRNDILKRLFELDKPFAMLINTNGLFDSRIRWDLFKENNFTLIYLNKRVNYMKEYGKLEKSSPPFQSAYICSKLSDKQIIFEEINTHKFASAKLEKKK
jgi:hypothetical protein